MLNNKQIQKLKSLSNSISLKYQIGKNEIDNDVVKLIDNALRAHELIKVYFNKSVAPKIDSLSNNLINKTNSILVAKIGHSVILYRENKALKNHIVI